jgi:hypothetical protein
MALDDGMREIGRALLEAAEQRAQLRGQLRNMEERVTALGAHAAA